MMRVDIVSWNVHGLPRPLDLHWCPCDRTPRHGRRVANVLQRIKALHPQPDILAFQEVWRDDDAGQIKAMRDYTVVESPNARFLRPTGLLTCIARDRWEIVGQPEVEPYDAGADVDKRSHKGFHIVALRERRTRERMMIANTHLQSQYATSGPKTYPNERKGQIEQLTRRAAALHERGVPLLACGDFNTYPYPSDRDVYRLMSAGAPWVDLTKAARSACGCETNFDSTHPTRMDGWIDYLLWFKDDAVTADATISLLHNARIDDPFSDHQGLRAEVRLTSSGSVELSLASLALMWAAAPTDRRQWLSAMGAIALKGIAPLLRAVEAGDR